MVSVNNENKNCHKGAHGTQIGVATLPTYSSSATPPAQQVSQPTASLTGQTREKKCTPPTNPVQRVRTVMILYLLGQWFWTLWVVGTTAGALSQTTELPSTTPMLAYIAFCVCDTCLTRASQGFSRTFPPPTPFL